MAPDIHIVQGLDLDTSTTLASCPITTCALLGRRLAIEAGAQAHLAGNTEPSRKDHTKRLSRKHLAVVRGGVDGGSLGGLFAKRDVERGHVTPFARGGIVSQPTLFPMANGAGLMGEAGPEAVMPLMRMPSGKLGVTAAGGGTKVNVTSVVNNHAAASAGVCLNRPAGATDRRR